MYKILISGYYGFNNIGDESILMAVIDNLRSNLSDIEITVLSQNPENTIEKYGVNAVNRKLFRKIIPAVKHCDLLISGGGSLLQDVTSRRSIFYYLMIMWMAILFRKKVFIYSQGIGPINSPMSRRWTARTLKKASGIVVRDERSREFLKEIGIEENRVWVTADPVLRIAKTDTALGCQILQEAGASCSPDHLTVGWSIKERRLNSTFVDELEASMRWLIEEYNAQIVLIPFHFTEDIGVIEELERRLGDQVCYLKQKYLTTEMLSIIGNMDVLVGVRLHSLIYAAVMEVPMMAISYDPKINSFMHSIDMKAVSSVYDFKCSFFQEEFKKTIESRQELRTHTAEKLNEIIKKLDKNEELIKEIMESGR